MNDGSSEVAGGTCLLLPFLWGGNSFKTCSFQSGCQSHSIGGRRGPQSLQGQARARHGGGEWACYCRTSPLKIPSRRNWECPSGSPGPWLSSCHFLYSNPQKFPISFFIKLNLLLPTCKAPLSWCILPRIPSSRSPPNPTLSFSSLFTLPKHTVYFTGFDQKV